MNRIFLSILLLASNLSTEVNLSNAYATKNSNSLLFKVPTNLHYGWWQFFIGLPLLLRSFNPTSPLFKPWFGTQKYFSQSPSSGYKLMVVAHPDDESLWGGCNLLSKPGWHIISVTNASHPIRKREFSAAMNYAKVSWEIWDHADQFWNKQFHPQLKEELKKVIDSKKWDLIVSHGPKGEYGHRQHKGLHKVMKELIGSQLVVFDPFSKRPVNSWCREAKAKLLNFYSSQKWTFKSVYSFGPDLQFGAGYESFSSVDKTK
ncbi:MAG: PIG-L family deacetylase [Oligoflexales bacterium]